MKKSTNNLNGLEYHRHYGLTNKQLVLLDIGNRNRNRNTGKCVCVPTGCSLFIVRMCLILVVSYSPATSTGQL